MATLQLLLALGGFLAVELFLWAAFLRLGAAWAKIPGVTFGRAFLTTVVVQVVRLPAVLLFEGLAERPGNIAWLAPLAQIAVNFVIAWGLIAVMLKARWWPALKAWLATLVPSLAIVLVALLVIRPFLFEGFIAPTNSMAPTLLGRHCQRVCPRCGGPAFASPPWREGPDSPPEGTPMICGNCLRTSRIAGSLGPTFAADRFLVNKMLSPRRWDIIVFRVPADPSKTYAKRLVGLPGEKVLIHDGSVWIDDRRLEPPPSLRGIEYLDTVDKLPPEQKVWGSRKNPVTLAADEYFVLGDFSACSADSRLWTRGAPGHAPYAVPASYIVGVVTHIFWPPSRWRSLR